MLVNIVGFAIVNKDDELQCLNLNDLCKSTSALDDKLDLLGLNKTSLKSNFTSF